MTASNMLHTLQNASQAGGEGKASLWFTLLSLHSFSIYLCLLNDATSLSSLLSMDWGGTGEQSEWQQWLLRNTLPYSFYRET